MNKFVEMSTFVSVVESQSFVGAAAKLGTSKSVVSQRVKMLEKRLGASLLERGPRLSLTEAGLLFIRSACVSLTKSHRRKKPWHPHAASFTASCVSPPRIPL